MAWYEKIVGDLSDKKRYLAYKARMKKLPAPYRSAAAGLERYLLHLGPSNDGAGLIRMLAVSSGTRSREAPDVPSLAEQGFPGFHMVSWTGMMAPAGTPKEIIDRMAAEFARALKDPQFVELMQKAGVEPAEDASPAAFQAFIAKEIVLWGEAVKIAGVTLQ